MDLGANVLEDLLIWQASDLARRKRYPEAEAILGLLENSESKYKSAVFDLFGKIKARQGQYAEAKACFQKAIALDPNNVSPREALDSLPAYIRKRRTLKRAGVIAPIMTLVIAISLFFWLGHSENNKSSLLKSNAGVPNAGTAQTGLSIATEKAAFQGGVPWPTFDKSGLTVTQMPSELRIVFDQGVFAEKCELTADGLRLIKLVAEKIKQSKEPFFIIIEGHTDNLPVYNASPYKDNLYLGLSRAESILSLFHSEYGLAKSMLLAVSAGEKAPQYSNDDDETRRKNRTVSLRILPIKITAN